LISIGYLAVFHHRLFIRKRRY